MRANTALGMVAAAVLLAVAGCSASQAGLQARNQDPGSSGVMADGWKEVPPPALAFEDFELPPSSYIVDQHGHFAIFQQGLRQEYPSEQFGVLDLDTGEHFVAVTGPVNSDARYFMCAPRIGDGWIAWEEVSPNESAEPDNAQWKLYAAALDLSSQRVGAPVLIDSGSTAMFARPFYGFNGSTLVWSRSLRTLAPQEAPAHHSSLVTRELPLEAESIIFESARNWSAMVVAGRNVVVTETPEAHEFSERLVEIDAGSGVVLGEQALPKGAVTAHFGRRTGDGGFVYSAFPGADGAWPTLYAMDDDGAVSAIRAGSMDAVPLGSWFLFERVVDDGPRGTRSQLCGLSAATREVFVLDEPDAGFWQTPMCVSSETGATDLMAVTLDLAPYIEDQNEARSVVRVYRVE